MTIPPKRQYLILLLLVLAWLVNGIYSINITSITADEGSHLSYGIRIIKGNPERTGPEKDNSKMPISALNAIPRGAEQLFSGGQLSRSDWGRADTINGRYITLLFSVLIILLVFQWSRQLYGAAAGLFSAFLFCFCPNNLAAAILVTTDTYSVFFLLAVMYMLWRYCNSHRTTDLLGLAIMLGLAQLAKQSLFHLYILVPACILLHTLITRRRLRFSRVLRDVLLVGVINWAIINAGFIFYDMNKPLGEYVFMSDLFKHVQQWLPSRIPVPFSSAFITGLDQAKFYDQLGGGFVNSSFGNVTIMGHSSNGGSFWYYYFVTLLFKTPIPVLVFSAWAVYVLVKKNTFRSFAANELFLLAPVVYFVLLMSFLYKTQVGVRHILFVYPLLHIFSGIIFKQGLTIRKQWIAGLLSLFLLVSVMRYYNNYFAYTNELIPDKKNAWKYVGASNLNFDQAYLLLDQYLARHPEVQRAPETPAKGKFVLVVDEYLDIWNTGKYAWLRQLQPVGEVERVFLLFDVK